MKIDTHRWEPLHPDEIQALLKEVSVPYWIAGGWAIDFFVGRQTRPHGDIDILILRRDQSAIHDCLSGWQLFKTKQPGLKLWTPDEYLIPPVNDIWCRKNAEKPWSMQLMLMETINEQWVYRRETKIGGEISSLGKYTNRGLPYLRPEIQLLYKSNLYCVQKDQHDFDLVEPLLNAKSKRWLLKALALQFPSGHIWIDRLKGKRR